VCCSKSLVPEGPNVYSSANLNAAPAEPNVAAAVTHGAPLEREISKGGAINIWPRRGQIAGLHTTTPLRLATWCLNSNFFFVAQRKGNFKTPLLVKDHLLEY
jgi:hypothetical protein